MRFSEREQKRRVVGRQQQRQLLGRGEQDVRRIAPLPLPPRHRRVAGAGLDLDRQAHLGDRRLQIARDVDRERLQRRDVEGVEAAGALHAAAGGDEAFLSPSASSGGRRQLHQGRQKSRPASCRRRSARSAAPSGRRGPLPAARADARAATSRATANHRRKRSGSSAAVSAAERARDRARHAPRAKPSEPLRRGSAQPVADAGASRRLQARASRRIGQLGDPRLTAATANRGSPAHRANTRSDARKRASALTSSRSSREARLLRHRLVGNLPVLAVEDRDVERLHRRVVVGRVAVIDVVEEERRVEAGQRRRLLQHVGAGQFVAAAAQDFAPSTTAWP